MRRASSMSTSRMLHFRESEHARQSSGRALELRRDVPTHPRLGVEAPHEEHAFGAVGLEVGAADEAVAGEQREHVIAVLALVLALVDLDHMAEAEEPLQQRA